MTTFPLHLLRRRALMLGALATVGLAGGAHAATDTTSVAVTGGSTTLSAPAFGDFPGVTLNGSAQTRTASVGSWSVNDASGTGDGWEVSVSASALETSGGTPVTMSGATLTLTAPTVAATDSSNTATAPDVAGGDILAGTVKVADADAGEGLGAWSFAQGASHLSLGVPADARAGTYTSTITTTLSTGV